jgi:(1->4)-alpha-D-glucan 1-alpha-D-glucosylmutase
VQLRPGFGFDQVAAVAEYLRDLGVSHLYASPYLQAAAGSTHGYDVVDPTHVNRELGGAEGHARMGAALGAAGLGQILDVVPNHMAITGRENTWWWDVLENGPSSVYASYFDVDWDPPESKLRNMVLLPILGDHYGRVLEAGEIRLQREGGGFVVCYHDHAAPIAPRSLDTLLAAAATRLPDSTRPGAPASDGEYLDSREQLESLATALGRLPPSWATDRHSVRERHRDKEVIRGRLAELCSDVDAVAGAVDAEVDAINADPDRLDGLLDRQNYRLAYWKTAGQELDYRRFFDIATLAGLRVEDDQVFADSHARILEWLAEGVLDGVRIDHIDGLRQPAAYLRRLVDAAPGAWVVVEKILEAGEQLPTSWPVAGTTGYDWLSLAGGLFVDSCAKDPLVAAYAAFTEDAVDYDEIVYASKGLVLGDALGADVNRLTELLDRICDRHRRYRDYARRDLLAALVEVLANFPVYRTYVTADRPASSVDAAIVRDAIDGARKHRPDIDGELLDFLSDLLLARIPGADEVELALRFQQVTGPVMAKGVEDTAFYRYLPLVSLNEVGDDPRRFGTTIEAFHEACLTAQREWPLRMLTTSTHDTKRSEDVRARISLLSELDEWPALVRRWAAANAGHRAGPGPDRNTEWLLYQTLVGAWPISAERLIAYLDKATREAKTHTSWIDPKVPFEDSVHHFVQAILADERFVADLGGVVARLLRPGWINSLALKLITLTAPGVPDLYQGSELWDLSLVDPDNRRPVDFDHRRGLLTELSEADPAATWAAEDGLGRSKLLVVWRALQARRSLPDCFGDQGSYEPLVASGPAGDHVVAFVRGGRVITVAPRLPLGLERMGGWGATTVRLPSGRFHNRLGDGPRAWSEQVALADLLEAFPVALLVAE